MSLAFAVAAFLSAAVQAPGSAPAPADSIACSSDRCAALLEDPIPGTLDRIVDLGGRNVAEVSPAELCARLIFPTVGRGDETADSLCGNLKVGAPTRDVFHEVLPLTYGPDEEYDSVGFRFRPQEVFPDKLRAFVPCFSPYEVSLREGREIRAISTRSHPFFDEDPTREAKFRCGYLLSGHGAPPYYTEFMLPEWASPVGEAPPASEHLALVLAHLADVEHGAEILAHLRRIASSPAERDRLCAKRAPCSAPRRLILRDGPFDEAIAYCSHDLFEGVYELPSKCVYAALRVRATGEWLLRALISPSTAFPSGNGLGDADISCTIASGTNALAVLRQKFPSNRHYRVDGDPMLRIERKGWPSEIYTQWRENLVIRAVRQGNVLTLTPIIYFSAQNPARQEAFEPIALKQYDYYVVKLIERLRPQLACTDARR